MKAVNLLPGDQRGSQKTRAAASPAQPSGAAFGAYIVLGVLAFAVVAMAGYVLVTNTVKDRKAELAQVTREAEATQAKAAALQSFADFKALADQRVQTVSSLASSRFDWDRSLADLSRALPSDVHLKSLSGTTGTQVSSGGGSLRGAIQAPALELSGCTTSQQGVARLMSRLRNVRGVTRVTLTKSDKDGAGAVTVAPTAADGSTQPSLCPKGSPPAFDLIVFFERAAVAAGATPNLGAAPAAGEQSNATPPANGTAASTNPPASGSAAGPSSTAVSATKSAAQGAATSATQGVSNP
jgi:Tfp pilus assembly protein PilN